MAAKNRTFRRRYIIEVKGITTNNFMVRFLDDMFKGVVEAVKSRFKQVEITRFEAVDPKEVDDADA